MAKSKDESTVAVLDEPIAAKPAPAENKTYRVIKGQVGPWNANNPDGNSFSMSQFKMVTALPSIKVEDKQAGTFEMKTIVPSGLDTETYWDGLIDRLVALQVIRYEPGLTVGEVPLGPECGPRYATLNNSQQVAMKEALELVSRQPLEGTLAQGQRRNQRIEPSEIGAAALRQV